MTESLLVDPEEAGQRLDSFLTEKLEQKLKAQGHPSTRSQIKRAIDQGFASVDGKKARAGQKLKPGQHIEFTPLPPEPSSVEPEEIPLDIVFEDASVVVVNKPPNMVVHPSAGHTTGTLVAALLAHCSLGGGEVMRPGIVHRLDQDTTGLIIVAKNALTHESLGEQFRVHSIGRTYLALVRGVPKKSRDTLHTKYGRHPNHRIKFSSRFSGSREAITHYEVRETFSTAASLVSCTLQTGRTHQVRVHLSDLGHPILGDQLYGGGSGGDRRLDPALKHISRQALHATRLDFDHPETGKRIELERQPPQDFQNLLEALRRIL